MNKWKGLPFPYRLDRSESKWKNGKEREVNLGGVEDWMGNRNEETKRNGSNKALHNYMPCTQYFIKWTTISQQKPLLRPYLPCPGGVPGILKPWNLAQQFIIRKNGYCARGKNYPKILYTQHNEHSNISHIQQTKEESLRERGERERKRATINTKFE